ncbi:MAG: hypothetical protein AB1543_06395, partial [Candidatus Bipolaricaulota bacterium]
SLAVAGVAGLGLTLLLSVVVRSREKGSLLAVGFIMLFVSYGHVYDQIEGVSLGGVMIGRHRYLLAVWGLAALAWTASLIRRRGAPRGLSAGLQAAGVALVAMPLLTIGRHWWSGMATARGAGHGRIEVSGLVSGAEEEYPDIFYIILDGYGRSDVLRDLYGVDNTEFLEFLESRGFYVAEESASNYSQTVLSLASSLNMRYLDDEAQQEGPRSANIDRLDDEIAHSLVRGTLATLGYRFVAFETGYAHTEVPDADLYFVPQYYAFEDKVSLFTALRLNEFESLLLDTTMVKAAEEYFSRVQQEVRQLTDFLYQKHRTRVLFTLESLPEIAAMPGHYFVFAHVISPHPPFVFGALGEEIVNTEPYSLRDHSCCTRDVYRKLYADQLTYVTLLVERTVDEILAQSAGKAIVILQADHGPGSGIIPQSPLESDVRERLSILNAYRVPEEARRMLYGTITPVNTFRLILSSCFGYDLDLLPDESYFSPPGRPYFLTRATGDVRVRE